MSELIKVGMADLKTCVAPDSVITLGLGSCVGVAVVDPSTKIGGLAHVMLPDSTAIKGSTNIAKFADTGVLELVKQMEALGANKSKMVAKIAGGANMFKFEGANPNIMNVGNRNVAAVKDVLKKLNIKLLAEDTGLNYGRTVTFFPENGEFHIKSVGKPDKII